MSSVNTHAHKIRYVSTRVYSAKYLMYIILIAFLFWSDVSAFRK